MAKLNHTWELYYPRAAATGLPFARARIDPADVLSVHAAPDALTAWYNAQDGSEWRWSMESYNHR